ncbi:MAG: 4Fe-4S binding protein [Oscillospiraceae bacterium]|nr:4Fe-4S binding protein [Oscillospiraceae bacterium]
MIIKRVIAAYFSPTGNSELVALCTAGHLADKWGAEAIRFDFTLPFKRTGVKELNREDLVVFGVPVYGGRIPELILPFLQSGFLPGGALAAPVVTYGGRAYEWAAAELKNVLYEAGFRVLPGAAFAARHSFTDSVAQGRPDDADFADIFDYAAGIARMTESGDIPPYEPVAIPPRGKGRSSLTASRPVTDDGRCVGCGLCVNVCPAGAKPEDDFAVTTDACIRCQACVRKCPQSAIAFIDPAFLKSVAHLQEICRDRTPNALFL